MKIDLENKTNYQLDEARLISLADFSLTKLGIHPDSELGIRIVNEIEMEELHQKWMNLSGATDVMSFPMDEIKPDSASNGPGIIGDIVLCPEFAARNGKQSTDLEIELLTVHGVLHLLGFDHEKIEDELVMFKMQEDFLNQWRALK
jgi:probable rRNA maturation factor